MISTGGAYKNFANFVTGRYLSEGLRITLGVALPAILLNYFNLLPEGIMVSLGALCASVTDNPGPIHHRRNGMLVCLVVVFITALLTGFALPYPWIMGGLIFFFCFTYSMIGVYGARANSIGVSALLIMVLSIERHHQGWSVVFNALYVLAGGVWYMILSLLLYNIRPYRLVKQALGDCIMAVAEYLRIRSAFYDKKVNYDSNYQRMLSQQIEVHEKQNLVRELLFKSRNVVKESTNTSRTLVRMFIDVVDLFERIMSSFQDYKVLHTIFDESGILSRFQQLLQELAAELENTAIAIQSGTGYEEPGRLQKHIEELKEYYTSFRDANRTAENFEGFITLRNILNNLEDLCDRIDTLHLYNKYDKKITKKFSQPLDYEKFISHQEVDIKQLKDNFTLKSNTFRHALRVSIATLAGFIISKFFPLGHSYWILLTIIVILKPAYSLAKKRNYQRVLGTVAGAGIGLLLIYFIPSHTVLFILMLFLMVGTYTFLRTNYLVSVIMMTPYILLLFHLLNSSNFKTIIFDRVIDTAIGSGIAFLANFFLVPSWEQEQIAQYMSDAIESNMSYFKNIAGAFTGEPSTITQYKLSRKNTYVALANLADAFSRMLDEPKSKQRNIKLIHQFVVLIHTLTSHIAALAYYVDPFSEKYTSAQFKALINHALQQLQTARAFLENKDVIQDKNLGEEEHIINRQLKNLAAQRQDELRHGYTNTETRQKLTEFKSIVDQFNFISKISSDIKKVVLQLETE